MWVIAGFSTEPLRAQNVSQPQNTGPSDASIAALLPQNGDPTGLRKWLEQHGTTFTLFYTNDVLGNLSGGIKRGTIDQGKVELQVTTDLDKVAGLRPSRRSISRAAGRPIHYRRRARGSDLISERTKRRPSCLPSSMAIRRAGAP